MNEPLPRREKRIRLRRGMYILPSIFTSINIAAGYFAITQSLQGSAAAPGHFDNAALAIGFAIPFDAVDGRIARITKTETEFGKELDSLADVITFGVAPSILAYTWGVRMLPLAIDSMLRQKVVALGAFISFLFLICGASRLARFNISHDPKPKNPGRPGSKYFVGMPIPAAAGVIASVVHLFGGAPVFDLWLPDAFNYWLALIWIALVGLVGFLMVSTWRFWSGKEISFNTRHPFQIVVLICALLALTVLFSREVLFLIALGYMFSGIGARTAYSWHRRRRGPAKLASSTLSTGDTQASSHTA